MAEWTTAYINALPDSAFACIDAGGEKDEDGRTVPRSLRHYPHHDASGALDMPHLRAAASRVAQEDTTSCGAGHLHDHADAQDMGKEIPMTERTHPKTDVGYKAFTPTDLQLSESGEVLIAFSRLNVRDKDGD